MLGRIPIIPTIVVIAAAATMVALGIWQLGRAEEKAALIAQYETAMAAEDLQFKTPDNPEAAFTRKLVYCGEPENARAISGRNAKGQNGWSHIVQCTTGGKWPKTEATCSEYTAIMEKELARQSPDFEPNPAASAEAIQDCLEPDPDSEQLYIGAAVFPIEVALGWSRAPDLVDWDGGFVVGTVAPTGQFDYRVVSENPIEGLEPLAKPDPKDLPNNHLAYAGQWFFFALTAIVIYFLALRSRAAKQSRRSKDATLL